DVERRQAGAGPLLAAAPGRRPVRPVRAPAGRFRPPGGPVGSLAWPIDEGPDREDLLLTQHTLAVAPGRYVAEVGAVHRLVKDRGQLVGGPIGTPIRIDLTIPA